MSTAARETIFRFVQDEVKRQGWKPGTPDYWLRVGAMLAAWNDARVTDVPMDHSDALRWGMMVEPEANRQGWRKCAVYVGGRAGAYYEDLPRLMDEWGKDVMEAQKGGEVTLDEADRLYVAFEKIHPFIDGNGRTGKIIHNYLLGTLESPVLVKDYFGGGVP